MPDTNQSRAAVSTSPLAPRSHLNSAQNTHLFLPRTTTRPEMLLPGADPSHSPSVFSSTVLCFTKATSPAPSARHLWGETVSLGGAELLCPLGGLLWNGGVCLVGPFGVPASSLGGNTEAKLREALQSSIPSSAEHGPSSVDRGSCPTAAGDSSGPMDGLPKVPALIRCRAEASPEDQDLRVPATFFHASHPPRWSEAPEWGPESGKRLFLPFSSKSSSLKIPNMLTL